MPKKTFAPLGETELELLQHVWRLGRATVADVHARVLEERPLAYTTVMNILRKLADKGYLEFEQEGPAYVYEPAKPASQVRASFLRDLTEKAFRGSPTALVQTLVEHGDLTLEQRAEIRRLVEAMDERPPGNRESSAEGATGSPSGGQTGGEPGDET